MENRKSMTVHYRKMNDVTGAFKGETLETKIRKAFSCSFSEEKLSERWKLRAWLVPPDNTDTMLLNIFSDGDTNFFGDLTSYTKGYMQALLKNVADVPMLAVEQKPAPQDQEYVHSIMFWLVIGNHVLMIQSRGLNSKHLEQYFTWLLKDKCNQIGENGQVILDAKFDLDDIGGELEDISEIAIGGTGAVEAASREQPERPVVIQDVTQQTDVGSQKSWGERALKVLRAVMSNEADVQNLLGSIPDGADLNVSVHIGYKSKKRKITRSPMQQALRNMPEGEITAYGRYGKLKGNDIRLSYPVRVKCNGSLPIVSDVQEKLHDAFNYFVKNGKIELES